MFHDLKKETTCGLKLKVGNDKGVFKSGGLREAVLEGKRRRRHRE